MVLIGQKLQSDAVALRNSGIGSLIQKASELEHHVFDSPRAR
jgi:hypothetical protein